MAALSELVEDLEHSIVILADRASYVSGPKRRPTDRQELDAELIPTTACLRCHDVARPGKRPAFSPIPLLSFDPFDAASRQTWLENADPRQKAVVLERMLRRVGIDRDMPPEDSTEYELFRARDPAAFESMRKFLQEESKKAKAQGPAVRMPRAMRRVLARPEVGWYRAAYCFRMGSTHEMRHARWNDEPFLVRL